MKSSAEIYAKMHKESELWVDDLRRARDYQAALAGVMALIHETGQRYSRGSVVRVALDNLELEITESFPAASLAVYDDEG